MRLPLHPQFHSEALSTEMKTYFHDESSIHSGFIHNYPKLETAYHFNSRWKGARTVVHSPRGRRVNEKGVNVMQSTVRANLRAIVLGEVGQARGWLLGIISLEELQEQAGLMTVVVFSTVVTGGVSVLRGDLRGLLMWHRGRGSAFYWGTTECVFQNSWFKVFRFQIMPVWPQLKLLTGLF